MIDEKIFPWVWKEFKCSYIWWLDLYFNLRCWSPIFPVEFLMPPKKSKALKTLIQTYVYLASAQPPRQLLICSSFNTENHQLFAHWLIIKHQPVMVYGIIPTELGSHPPCTLNHLKTHLHTFSLRDRSARTWFKVSWRQNRAEQKIIYRMHTISSRLVKSHKNALRQGSCRSWWL